MSAYLLCDAQPAMSTPTGESAVIAKTKKMPTSKLAARELLDPRHRGVDEYRGREREHRRDEEQHAVGAVGHEVFLAEKLDGVGDGLERGRASRCASGPCVPAGAPVTLRSTPHHDDRVDEHDDDEDDDADEDSERAHRSISPMTTSTEPMIGDDVTDARPRRARWARRAGSRRRGERTLSRHGLAVPSLTSEHAELAARALDPR